MNPDDKSRTVGSCEAIALVGKNKLTRQRLLELTILAKETADVLNAKGLSSDEYCQFGDIVRNMLNLS